MKLQGIFGENREVFKIVAILLLLILLCRLTSGLALGLTVFYAMGCMSKRKMGGVILCYVFLTFMINMNRTLIGGINGFVFRGSFVIMTVMMIVQASSRVGIHRAPLGTMYLYLILAAASSVDGWCPPISYLKLINFVLFLAGLHFGTKNLHHYPDQIDFIRHGILAFAVLLIGGSIAVIPFPSIGYSMMLSHAKAWMSDSDAMMMLQTAAVPLYSGVTNHSQSLAPFVVCMGAWILCDMLMVERRFNPLHVVLLMGCPVLLYMTRSRVGLLGMVVAISIIYFYTINKIQVRPGLKMKLRSAFTVGLMLMAAAAVVMEAKDNSISKWIRKTGDVSKDNRNLSEAVTASRQGAIEENLYYFHKRPMLGMGFQVEESMKYMYEAGKITFFSAPIEKGLLPLMILGETGVAGAILFGFFLIVFTGTCIRKRYYATVTLFYVMLATNMGEATFFAPTAVGGCFWIVAIAGGFSIDMKCLSDCQRNFDMTTMRVFGR